MTERTNCCSSCGM